jgi:SAM-dependent methyltransferase
MLFFRRIMLKCKICDSDNLEIFHNIVFGSDKSKVYKCLNCEVKFLYPYLSDEEIDRLYEGYEDITLSRGLIDNISGINTLFEAGLAEAKQRYGKFLEYIEEKSVLEFGPGAGSFVYYSKKTAKEIHAIEPSNNHREFIINELTANIYTDIDVLIEKNIKFDSIFLFHVFEHLNKPHEFLSKIKLLLGDSGYFIIEVPHADDALISLYDIEDFKDFYFQIQHPFYYNEHGLQYIFKKNGFKTVKVIYHQRYGIDNHLNWLKNRTKGGNDRYKEFFYGLDDIYRNYLIEHKKSDTISLISQIKD